MKKRDRYIDLDVLLAAIFLFWYIFTGNILVLVPSIMFSCMDIICQKTNKKNPLTIKLKGKSDESSDISDREGKADDQ